MTITTRTLAAALTAFLTCMLPAGPIASAQTPAAVEGAAQRIRAYIDGEREMRAIYEKFLRQRTTPADPQIIQEVRDAQRDFEAAVRSGDERAIAKATLALDEARLVDMAYALGRGDPAAK